MFDFETGAVLTRGGEPGALDRARLGQALADPFFAEMLFDQLPDVVFFVKNKAGLYLAVNQTLAQRCGFKRKSDLIGRSPVDVFPHELGVSYEAQDKLVAEQGRAIQGRLELHLYPNRTRGWCLTDKIPLYNRDGLVIGVAGISRDLHAPDKSAPFYERVAEALDFMQEHFAEPLRLNDLAQNAGMSVTQLERHVQRIFGLSPKQLIVKIRLDAATQLLEKQTSVADIAHACGYADQSAFTRQFKATAGVTPGEYRALLRAKSAKI